MPLNIALRSPVVQAARFRRLPVASLRLRRLRGSLSVLVLFVSLTSPNAIAQGVANEYQVKAAFLYNFAKFVEWPDGTFANSTSPLTVCVLGKDPFGKALDDAIVGKRIAGHPAILARAKRIQDLPECQIIFVSASDSPQLPEILRELHGRKALVVGETENFAGLGGAIQFVLEANRVRFAINTDAADRAGLKVSSKLLALATIVHDNAAGGNN
jgi:uncharacterized protein DUF4154